MQRIVVGLATPRVLVQSAPSTSSARSHFSTHSGESRIGASTRLPRRANPLKVRLAESRSAPGKTDDLHLFFRSASVSLERAHARQGSVRHSRRRQGRQNIRDQEGLLQGASVSDFTGSQLTLPPALQLAKKFHPDSNKEKTAKEKFVEIQNAYDVRNQIPLASMRFHSLSPPFRLSAMTRSEPRSTGSALRLSNLASTPTPTPEQLHLSEVLDSVISTVEEGEDSSRAQTSLSRSLVHSGEEEDKLVKDNRSNSTSEKISKSKSLSPSTKLPRERRERSTSLPSSIARRARVAGSRRERK